MEARTKFISIIHQHPAFSLFVLSIVLFPLAIGTVHLFDWDEVNFAEISREMIVTQNYLNVQINFQPFWEKPPLFFWIQSLSMHLFGINEFAARFPNVLVGVSSILYLYRLGKQFVSKEFGLIWALSFLGSLLPHFYFKSGIIDPLFNLLIFASLHLFYEYQLQYRKVKLILASSLAGLAVLTKGPVAILIIVLVVFFYILLKRKEFKIKLVDVCLALVICLLISSIWFLSELLHGGGVALIQDFFAYQLRLFTTSEAGHGQPFFYHFVVLFFGCFPISLVAFPSILNYKQRLKSLNVFQDFYSLNFILFWVVLLLFSMTTTKIVHYSSLCYFPLSFMASTIIYRNFKEGLSLHRLSYFLLVFVGVILSILFLAFPLITMFKSTIIPFIKDPFAVANILEPVQWSGYEFLIGLAYFIGLAWVLKWIKKNSYYFIHLFLLNAFTLTVFMIVVVPKIEQHVQGSLIAFFKAHQKKTEYVTTFGFKSYAQFYYTQKQPSTNHLAYQEQWLLYGEIDQPVFIASKLNRKDEVLKLSNTVFLYEKGGFVFAVRNPDPEKINQTNPKLDPLGQLH